MFGPVLLCAVIGAAPPPPGRDSDGDGIADEDEDTNHNGVVDPGECDPRQLDSDHDNVPDAVERLLGSDPTDPNDVPPIPEPLFLDLIRNLGSRRGELEVNSLASTTYRGRPAVSWGPEVEYAPISGLGLELEFPMTDRQVEAIKPGAQVTLGSLAARRLDFGLLGTHEQRLQEPSSFSNLAVVTGVRFSHRVTAITIVGPSVLVEKNQRPTFGGVLSPTVFLQVNRTATIGLELGFRIDGDGTSEQSALPQLHLNVDQHVNLQLGMGAAHDHDALRPFTAVRVSWER